MNSNTFQKPSLLAWGLLILLALIWGSSFIIIKKGLEIFSPAQVASIRVSSGYLILLVFAARNFRSIQTKKWKYLFISGFTGIFIPAFFFAFAQIGLSSSLTAVLNTLTPLFTLIIGVLFFNQKTTFFKVLGVIIALFGAVGLILLSSKTGKLAFNYYALFVIGSTIFYGFNVNLTKNYLNDIKALHLTSFSLFLIGPLAIIALLANNTPQTVLTVPNAETVLGYLIFLGITSTALAMILFNKLLQISSPIFASSVTYLIPIVAILWGIWDGEQLKLIHFACIGVILSGVWMVNSK